MKKLTEETSLYHNLEKMDLNDLLININQEDQKVAKIVEKSIPKISKLANVIIKKLATGGRLFYIGAGTSGRLAVLDAAECPPTFCTSPELVQAIIAGGHKSVVKSSENLEDSETLSIDA